MTQSEAFEAYRASPPKPITLWRLFAGLLIIVAGWLGLSVAFVIIGSVASGGNLETIADTRLGALGLLATFSGIWIGAWLAMRYVHKESLRNLLGVGGRVATGDFWRGFGAVGLTSLLSEVLIYMVWPEFTRSPLELSRWALYAIPVTLLCLVQTSSEELLFRGYLVRGLANRFRSPWIWALLPGLAFLALHYSPGMDLNDMLLVLFTIGALTVALTIVVYVTGNLGAAFGMHMANNLAAFLLVSHQSDFGQFALFQGTAIDEVLSTQQTVTLTAISLISVALTIFLLLYRGSPLRVRGV